MGVTVNDVWTYEKLGIERADFAAGRLNFLIVLGPRGTAKTHTFVHEMKVPFLYHKGEISARKMYEKLYINRDKPIILDDIVSLFKNYGVVQLILSLTDTINIVKPKPKVISYGKKNLGKITYTDKHGIEITEELPEMFETNSKLCLIANKVDKKIPGTVKEAILDRGQILRFQPSNEEIHKYAAAYVKKVNKEVYEHIGQQLETCPQHSLRFYNHAIERFHRSNWKEEVTAMMRGGNNKWLRFVHILKNNKQFPRIKDKMEEFVKQQLGCEKTYHNWKIKYDHGETAGDSGDGDDIFA